VTGRGEDPPDRGGDGDGDEQPPDPLARWIAISLAAIALLGAGLAILQTNASNDESNTARQTTRTAVEALRAGVVENAARRLERDIEAERADLLRRQEAAARQAGGAGAATRTLSPEELAAAVEETGGDLPGRRTEQELGRLQGESERLTLTQAALAETRVTWNDRSTQYTTAIAMLAVALFLVGFSLVLRGRLRRAFYALGLAMALVTVAWSADIYSLPIPETPEAAIAATARGTVDASGGRQRRAIEEFTRAIEIDGDYAVPYSRRAIARALEANPDLLATGAVTGDGAAVAEALADARRALELGATRDVPTLTLLATFAFYSGEYGAALAAADEAIAVNDQVADIRLLRSASQVGRGDAAGARASLEGALRLFSGSDPSERTRGLAAEYATYLEQVIADAPSRADLARALEQRIVAVETGFNLDRPVSGAAPPRGSATVHGLRYADGRLRLRLRWDDLPAGTALSAIGFERPATGAAWVQPPGLALFRTVGGSGGEAVSVALERACTPTRVRVDVSLDGALTESVTGPGGAPIC